MAAICFRLSQVPDLSLAKYASLDDQGVDAVLGKHIAFLRQFSRKPDVSLHLFYVFDPGRHEGDRLQVFFTVLGTSDSLANVTRLTSSSVLAPYFTLTPGPGDDDSGLLGALMARCGPVGSGFGFCSTLTKQVAFINPKPPHAEAPNGYYTLPEFEVQENSRLFSLAKVMEALGERLVYRVDLYPSNRAATLRDSLPLAQLRKRQDESRGVRDFTVEGIIKGYEGLLEKFDGSPHFNVNVVALADSAESGRAVLDAAGAEAVKTGSTQIAHFAGQFDLRSFLDPSQAASMLSTDRATCGVPTPGRSGCFFFPAVAKGFAQADLATLYTLDEAAAFFKLPTLYDGEVIQLKKETAPPVVTRDQGLFLGRDDNGYEVHLPMNLLPKHAFIAGVPGSGKTNLMLHLASTLWVDHHIPFLVLEPAKREYRALLNQPGLEGVTLFSPAGQPLFPLRINPFELPVGISVGQHISRLCQVFEGAFPLEGALPFLLDRSIEACYRDNGWLPKHIRTGREDLDAQPFPTVGQLYGQLGKELEQSDYEGEIRGNLKSAFQTRIGGLLRREQGEIFDVPRSTIDPGDWLKRPAIIELAGLGRSQANFLTLLLCVLIRESLMADPVFDSGPVRHVLFIEEAHNVIGPEAEEVSGEHADPKQAATAFIRDMLAEVRALRQGIVIADQLPTAMAPEVIKNTGLKIGLRITSADDRELLGSTMAASALQLEQMATSMPGSALISYEGLLKPFRIQAREWLGPDGASHIEDPAERSRTATAKPDQALVEVHRETPWHRGITFDSALIDLEGFTAKWRAFDQRSRPLLGQMRANFALMDEVRSLLTGPALDDAAAAAVAALLESANGHFAACRTELARLGLGSVHEAIGELEALITGLEERLEDWAHLGFTAFVGPGLAWREIDGDSSPEDVLVRLYLGLRRDLLGAYRQFVTASRYLFDQATERDIAEHQRWAAEVDRAVTAWCRATGAPDLTPEG
jgi:hypothetical protein